MTKFNKKNYLGKCFTCAYYNSGKQNNIGFMCENGVISYQKPISSCRYYRESNKSDKQYESDFERLEDKSSNCYITTIVVDILGYDDNCDYLNTLRFFRDNVLQKDDKYISLLKDYDVYGPIIASELSLLENDRRFLTATAMFQGFIIPTCNAIMKYDYTKAIDMYIYMVLYLKDILSIEEKYDIKISNDDYIAMCPDSNCKGHGFSTHTRKRV